MRTCLNSLAKRFPPRHVTDRLFPWIMVLLTTIGGIWILYEHNASNKVSRISKIIELYHQFSEPSIGNISLNDIQRELADVVGHIIDKTLCEHILERIPSVMRGYANFNNLNCKESYNRNRILKKYVDTVNKEQLRQRISNRINDTLRENDEDNIDKLLSHYRGVIACIQHDGCDEEAGFDIYKTNMIGFVNMSCMVTNERAIYWNTEPADIPIVNFLIRHGFGYDDFYCDHHADLVHDNFLKNVKEIWQRLTLYTTRIFNYWSFAFCPINYLVRPEPRQP